MKDLNHLFGRIPIRTKLLILTFSLATAPLIFFFGLSVTVGFTELKTVSLRSLESESAKVTVASNDTHYEGQNHLIGEVDFCLQSF